MATTDHIETDLSKEEKTLLKQRIFEKIAPGNIISLQTRLRKKWMLLLYVLAIAAMLAIMFVNTSHQKTKDNITVKHK